ncbi:MAG TPA: BON domain-containing protein [Acidimicrobiales bacterium]|nr:BON domain-containing protein [Acidimicrobiales bacterium]
MTGPDPLPTPYLVGHIQDTLATDGRAQELGVDVTVAGNRVVLNGTVATEGQREAIGEVAGEVVAEHAPGHEVVNELTVMSHDEDGSVEELA